MDSRPFLVLDLLDIDRTVLPELKKLTKPSFDINSIASSAEELKYVGALKRAIAEEFKSPSDDLVKLLASHVYDGTFRQNVLAKFHSLVEKALKRFLTDQVNDRLATALGADGSESASDAQTSEDPEQSESSAEEDNDGIETTDEERAGFLIIKAIACSEVDQSRVTMRDAKSYCAVFLDNNNRKPIARMYFNAKQKYIGIFDENKECTRNPIDSVGDIYNYAEDIREEIRRLLAD